MCCEYDLQAVEMLRNIFAIAIQPLLKMITDFIYTGTFNDPCSEFFVEKEPYKLSEELQKIPSFIGEHMALAIFKVGQHVNLLSELEIDRSNYFNICN